MEKTAFAYWGNRIAAVFDTARQLCIVEAEQGKIIAEAEEILPADPPVRKAMHLAEIDIDTLVCGAISRPFHEMIVSYGIRVIPFVAGDLREVIQAWIDDSLEKRDFIMPGCCGAGRRRRQGIHDRNREEHFMNGRQGGGRGAGGGGRGQGQGQDQGQGRGQRRGGRGKGLMGGPLAGGAVGTCLCPQCGHREPHERGVPCVQKQCPKCGTALVRE